MAKQRSASDRAKAALAKLPKLRQPAREQQPPVLYADWDQCDCICKVYFEQFHGTEDWVVHALIHPLHVSIAKEREAIAAALTRSMARILRKAGKART